MSVITSHDSNITINVIQTSTPLTEAGFGRTLLMVDEAGGSDLNGDRTAIYADTTEAAAAVTAGYLSSAAYNQVVAIFAQRPSPSSVMVGRVDTGGSETYATAWDLIRADNDDFYGVMIDKRSATEILLVAAKVEALSGAKLFIFQNADADWLTSGIPSAFSAAAAYEWSAVVYHDTATVYTDAAMLGTLAFDPDVQSAPWDRPVKGVTNYATALTSTQRTFALANGANVLGKLGSENFVIDPGVNLQGRPLYEQLTVSWFDARLNERFAAVKNSESTAGRKITVTPDGQSQLLGEILRVFDLAVEAGHITEYDVQPLAITDSDKTARRIRFSARAVTAVSARLFTFTLNISTTSLAAA